MNKQNRIVINLPKGITNTEIFLLFAGNFQEYFDNGGELEKEEYGKQEFFKYLSEKVLELRLDQTGLELQEELRDINKRIRENTETVEIETKSLINNTQVI